MTDLIPYITTTAELSAICQTFATEPYITIDTEFVRRSTYYPQLALVQIAGANDAVIIDPQAEGIDLQSLFELMQNESVLKVFHSARQDIEIFLHRSGAIPRPVFDTQIAAMVCGHGESVAYNTLVAKLAGVSISKDQRFTDWSRRPLTKAQLSYAISDVTHLRVVYQKLQQELEKSGRTAWIGEEMDILTDTATYILHPEDAWTRLKFRSKDARFIAVVKALAAWREEVAVAKDRSRGRVLQDDLLLDIAASRPTTLEALASIRNMGKNLKPENQKVIVERIARVMASPLPDDLPEKNTPRPLTDNQEAVHDVLKLLLKYRAGSQNVATKLVADSSDLKALARSTGKDNLADVRCRHGWRYEVFGKDAEALLEGRLTLQIVQGKPVFTEVA